MIIVKILQVKIKAIQLRLECGSQNIYMLKQDRFNKYNVRLKVIY